jgi:quercetin dioxygenase-like cupin family protein
MNPENRCFCELVPLYALDLLDGEERLWVESQIVDDPDLELELAEYQTAVSNIAYSAPPVTMAADLKDRLFDRLDLEPVETLPPPPAPKLPQIPDFFTVRSSQIKWRSHPRCRGVQIASLYIDRDRREAASMVKAEPGVLYPRHRHAGIEEIYMLEGELMIGTDVYGVGDYIRSHPGSMHAPETTTGCMFFIKSSLDDEYFDDLVIDN